MKVHIQLFLFFIVASCQAGLLPLNKQLVSRQGIDPSVIKYYGITESPVIPDPNHKVLYQTTFYPELKYYQSINPLLHTRLSLESIEANRKAELAEIDREALSKLNEADRQLLVTQLSPADREQLLVKLREGKLDEILPVGESRFGAPQGGLKGAAAQIGAGAGEYIGRQLAGALGAKLGSAAGAYIGAAAASRLLNGISGNSNGESNVPTNPALKYGGTYGGGYGAVLVKNK